MATGYSGKKAHDDAITASEGVRQQAVKNAANQAAIIAAEKTHALTCRASSLANNGGTDIAVWNTMLRELGVQY